MTKKYISYEGKEIFIGIDVHRQRYAVAVVCDRTLVQKVSLPASPEALIQFLLERYQGARVRTAYEAGFSGFGLHRALVAVGIDSIVVNAASIEVDARNKVKTDKRDAVKLAVHLSEGRLRCIRIPSEQEELTRTLTRTREQLVRSRSRIITQVRMKLLQFGKLPLDYTRVLTIKVVRALELQRELAISIESLLQTWETLSTEIKNLERALKAEAQHDAREAVYRQVPGIGAIGARVLSNELGTMEQFENERRLFSYCGLTPSEHSSGDKIRKGHISRQGSARVRHILTEAAWRAIAVDPDLSAAYQRISQRAGGKRAIIAIARKLLGRIRRIFRTGESYCLGKALPVAA